MVEYDLQQNMVPTFIKPAGQLITWDLTYGGRCYYMATSLIQTTEGDYVVAGSTEYKGVGEGDIWIIKLNMADK